MTVPTVSLVASCRFGKQLENQINKIGKLLTLFSFFLYDVIATKENKESGHVSCKPQEA